MLNRTRLMLITPDLSLGGAERVMATLANNLSKKDRLEIHLILLIQGNEFYEIDPKVKIHRPDFHYKKYPRLIAFLKTVLYLRDQIKIVKPKSYLSFGGKYNSLAIAAGLGLSSNSFVSDRSRPGISYGKLQDYLNKKLYPKAEGLVAQTTQAKNHYVNTIGHKNIRIIGNPTANLFDPAVKRKKVVLNVGRFIGTKKQELLIDMFSTLDAKDWELWFLGDGELLNRCRKKAKELQIESRVKFLGTRRETKSIYNQSAIFAFTSVSEGFPNALAEAMSAGCACISFDCVAGPSDLIDDTSNGFLIPLEDYQSYALKLQELLNSASLRKKFGIEARKKMATLEEREIAKEYLEFLIGIDE